MNDKLRQRAQLALEERRVEDALAAFKAVVAADRTDVHALRQVAQLSKALGRVDEALTAFRSLGERYITDGLMLRALAAFKEVLELAPDDRGVKLRLEALARLRDREITRAPAPVTKSSGPVTPGRVAIQRLITPSNLAVPMQGREARIPLFSELPDGAFVELATRMPRRAFSSGEVVVEEGARGHSCFVTISGRVRVEKARAGGPPLVLAHLREGSIFGEMALLSDAPRTASVIAEEPVEAFEIERELLEELVERHPSLAKALRGFHRQRILTTLLSTHVFFRPMTDSERDRLRSAFKSKDFEPGDVIFAEGSSGAGLYLVLSGELSVRKVSGDGELELAKLHPGDVFGEASLIYDRPTSASVVATRASVALRLDRQVFSEVIEARPQLREALVRLSAGREDQNRETQNLSGTGAG
ncbi:MAG: cyclic nucleotide-binding domain-containing protein [Deltaproteobacteria bacterium]|nr:cyclic nucleotide-binding domain-containing protein [Deltaproteobacteria bacterium]